ncbi:UvrD-helicase domain-containing protein [Streptomyces sp. CNQ085]|uniref:UvrD-helicase domain-containing protein n=1 Tax=Streptomyces sp. CNQ085 TaxID=2886944 RepID=UPI001F5101DA|nr:UvrD-helicase domain-containing protein [Streptomyces sp. CNQ085]MCI0383654.1 AAA family ATPase [Streptomyces sp. CNQ085]
MGLSLPDPKGHQRDVVFLNGHGHCVVLGTAGSGKTTMAVHRAHYLATAPGIGGRTLLVTFNKALVTYLKGMVDAPPNLQIENYHRFALGYITHRTRSPVRICKFKKFLVEQALEEARARHPSRAVTQRPLKFFLDELHWMVGHGVTDQETYVENRTRRVGRGTPLQGADREVVFDVYQRYIQLRAEAGFEHDWDDVASTTLAMLQDDPTERHYRHVVVDEGQDFTPQMIRSLTAAIPDDGSLTFFGDYAQQIYGSRMSWRSLGLRVPGVVEFAHNYRNSRQIAQLAQAISDMPHFRDDVDLVQPARPAADGPKPTILQAASMEQQLAEAARTALALGTDRQVAILMRTREHEDVLRSLLTRSRATPIHRLHRDLTRWTHEPGVFYGTYSAAKGLEFDSVILPLCDGGELPSPSEIEAHGIDEARAREARQLYVAITRAREDLVLMHSSKLTDLLPSEMSGLYVRVSA